MIKVADILIDIGLSYKPVGENFIVSCWFHSETKPSMSIHQETGVYHCFSCKRSGNLFNILKDHLDVTGFDALQYLARFSTEKSHNDSERVSSFYQEVINPRNKDKKIEEIIIEVPEYQLLRIHPYLIKRSMEEALPLKVPVLVDIGVGKNWLEAH